MSLPSNVAFTPIACRGGSLAPFSVRMPVSTCTGIVVLAILLGSIVVAALQGPPDNPGHASAPTSPSSWPLCGGSPGNADLDPTVAGYRVGIVGSLWLLGLVAVVGIPVGVGAGVYLEETRRRAACGASFKPTSPTWQASLRLSTASWV